MIVAVEGGLGAGKTLVASVLAAAEAARGQQVWANYALHCAERLASWSQVFAMERGLVVFDEFHVEVDSRSFKNNVEFTSWLLQLRKMDLDLIFTTQGFGQVDLRVRTVTDVLVRCTKRLTGSTRFSDVMVVDLFDQRILKRFMLRHTPAMYALYDTKARVYPLARDAIGRHSQFS